MRALLRAGREAAETLRLPRSRSAAKPTPVPPPLASAPRRAALVAIALGAFVVGTRGTQDAVANGDTRTLSIIHEHTKESLTVTFRRDGRYDRAALEQLNWLLRDWRIDEPTKMDPRLFDVVWEAHRATGSRDAVHIVSAYRSPQTNAALRRRSRGVAEHSQHMLGKAMDFYLTDVSVDDIRAVGMRMQRGGVGWYPHSHNPFVHLDVGSVRSWPRMPYDQLARLFPDGRTVHLPREGRMMPGYEEAKAEIIARGGTVMGYSQAMAALDEEESPNVIRQLWTALFGGGSQQPTPAPVAARAPARVRPVALASAEDGGTRSALAYAAAPDPRSALLADLPPPRTAPAEPPRQAAELPRQAAEAPRQAAAPVLPAPTDAAPLPPRRPAEFVGLAEALVAAPLPPSRPAAIQVATADPAALGPMLQPRPARSPAAEAASGDAKAQLRALFTAAADPASAPGRPVRLSETRTAPRGTPPAGLLGAPAGEVAARFQPRGPDEVAPGRFSGTAVKPQPVRR
ncbi:DUF882 domain-containing protein [Methylobacterium oryzisoli]|uniref:DUF882 domain-containing protein n=1 Tax=Methylobacterium oryzisoli TaxID=3385502 RepID=UPI0038923B7B